MILEKATLTLDSRLANLLCSLNLYKVTDVRSLKFSERLYVSGAVSYYEGACVTRIDILEGEVFELSYNGLSFIFLEGVAIVNGFQVTPDNYFQHGLNSFSISKKTSLPTLCKEYTYHFS